MSIINLLKYLFLGLIQGFTEPLPISSSGHLVMMEHFIQLHFEDLNYEAILNFGSLFAIIFFYRNDILELISNFFSYIKSKEERYRYDFHYCWKLLIATIPAGIVGLLFNDFFDLFKTIFSVGIALMVTGLALLLVNKNSYTNQKSNISYFDALIIGLFQVIALIPGISRSGSTMVGGLSRKINIENTLKFSFLMYIPISIAAGLLGIYDIVSSDTDIFFLGYIGGFILSAIATYFAIKWLIRLVKAGNLKYFSYYCFVVSISIIFYSFIQIL